VFLKIDFSGVNVDIWKVHSVELKEIEKEKA